MASLGHVSHATPSISTDQFGIAPLRSSLGVVNQNGANVWKCEPKSSDLRIRCEVCGDRSSGFHYGVHACEGCKGFFRRTVRMKLKYKECESDCVVDVRNRNKCQYCRFNKCVRLGMSHDAIRFGRMSRLEKYKIIAKIAKEEPQSSARARGLSQKDEDLRKLTDDVATAFQEKLAITRTKINILWNLRKSNDHAYITLDKPEDICLLQRIYWNCDTPSTSSDENDFNQHSTQRFDPKYVAALFRYSSSDSGDVESMITDNTDDSASTDDSNERLQQPHRYGPESGTLDEELLQLLQHIVYVGPEAYQLTTTISEEGREKQMPVVGEILKEYENLKITSSDKEKVQDCVPLMKIIFSFAGIRPENIRQYAVDKDYSIIKAFFSLMSRYHVRTCIERNVGLRMPELAGCMQRDYPFSSSQSRWNEADREDIIRLMFGRLQRRIVSTVTELTEFAKRIPGFRELCLDDQVVLLKFGSFEALFVILSCAIVQKGVLLREDNIHVTFNFISGLGQWGRFVQPKLEFADKLAKLKLSDEVLALFLSIVIFISDRPGLKNPAQVEGLQSHVIHALDALLQLHYPKRPHILAKLLLKLVELRELSEDHIAMTERMVRQYSMYDLFDPLMHELCSD